MWGEETIAYLINLPWPIAPPNNSRGVVGQVSLRPQEIGTHHNGNVACRHLCHLVVLRELVQEGQKVPV